MVRVGHSYMMREMEKQKAVLGGEIASHFYFGDTKVYSDATYSALRMLDVISRIDRFSRVTARLPKYYSTPLMSIPVPEDLKNPVMKRVEEMISKLKGKIVKIDGVKILLQDGWILVRPSNTKPEIKYRAEASSETEMLKLEELVRDIIRGAISEYKGGISA